MREFDVDIDRLIDQVSVVEETLEFLTMEMTKHGKTEEIQSRIVKEYPELRKLSNEMKSFCDKYGIESNDEDPDDDQQP